jgi:hypothetical protein
MFLFEVRYNLGNKVFVVAENIQDAINHFKRRFGSSSQIESIELMAGELVLPKEKL